VVGDVSSDEESPALPKKEPRMKTGKVLHLLSRASVTFTSVVEKSRELLHECKREEQNPRKGGVTQVVTGRQERRGSEASLRA
jgi:hypothetical protein